MLDLYGSQPSRHKPQKLRFWLDASAATAVLGFLVVAMTFPGVLPPALRFAGGHPAEAEVSGPRAWAYENPPPASRAWAAGLESSLLVACRLTLSQMRDPKRIGEYLALQRGAAELADAIASQGNDQQFLGSCLRWGYDSISHCNKPGKALAGTALEVCVVPPVQRALALEPWKRCAAAARLDRVRAACSAVAQAIQPGDRKPAGM